MRKSYIQVSPTIDGSAAHGLSARRGFALPLAILVLAVLTVGLAASFASTGTEILTNNAQRSESRAYAIAENGLQEFIALRDQKLCTGCGSPPTVMVESTTVYLPGGRAEVKAMRVMKNLGIKRPAVYLIVSRGIDTVTPLNGASMNTRAERVVAQYAYWDMKSINILSGWTSLSGLQVNGGSATLSGNDHCGANPEGVAGVAVPTGTYSGKAKVVDGAPGQPDVLNLGTPQQARDAVHIDWQGIISETTITPDLSLNSGQSVPANFFSDPLYWPIIHVKGNFNVSSGRGLLIVDGNATFSGSGTWNGIILTGGSLTSNGNNQVYGAVVTGLNTKLGQVIGADDTGNGNKFYGYDSCTVAAATAGIGHYRLFSNAWMDNFTTY